MKIISFYESGRQEHWLKEIKRSPWGGASFLHELLSKNTFFDAVGECSKVLLLTSSDELVSFCTYSKMDDIQPTELTPWIGFVYTFPEHRGHRFAGILFNEVKGLAKLENVSSVYISTNHTGLYEKYGCEYFAQMTDIHGEPSRIYVMRI